MGDLRKVLGKDTDLLRSHFEGARVLLTCRGRTLANAQDGRAKFLDGHAALQRGSKLNDSVFLGRAADGTMQFSVEVEESIADATTNETFVGLREQMDALSVEDANVCAYACGMSNWHAKCRFCIICGGKMLSAEAGHVRTCSACNVNSFPRTDPAVIMLVVDGDRCVLGRNVAWPTERYSTLAGFVEPGESLEDAVRRELKEEVGISVSSVKYHSSQPWPFPASLMIGFMCQGDAAIAPTPNKTEISDAQWFTREEIRNGKVKLPPKKAISHALIDAWLEGTSK